MTMLDAAILGLVQGLTEFLPVSSSGHLVLFQNFLQTGPESFTVDVFLHFATLFAVIIFFWKDLWQIKLKDLLLLLIASVPAALIGILFHAQLEALFASGNTIGWELLITAGINFWIDRILGTNEKQTFTDKVASQFTGFTTWWKQLFSGQSLQISPQVAVLVGVAQAAAIMPAISRSGMTVWAALLSGVDRKTAFTFSFMLSIPAILGANVLELVKIYQDGTSLPATPVLMSGGLMAFVSGLLSLYLLRYMIRQAKFELFGWYCLILGLVVIGFQL
jgi:undecaprenyl-diphosphatase